jgi:hypothetical protein
VNEFTIVDKDGGLVASVTEDDVIIHKDYRVLEFKEPIDYINESYSQVGIK